MASRKNLGYDGTVPHWRYAMISMKIEDLQHDLQVCLNHIKAGESMVLLENGKPVAEIKPLPAARDTLRPYGLCAGQFAVPDDFDAPLPDEVLREFEA
jgi:antitoxin (DNA-binding transcriptional repressor) of toxin-antitoxin stability system